MSSSNSQSQSQKPSINYGSPCAACKFLRRKCLPDCIFAPHFPADQPKKFEVVHLTYGASNVSKLLNQLSYDEQAEAAQSLIYEAEAWQIDPVHGCIGFISVLQKRLKEIQTELEIARGRLSTYMVSEPEAVNVLPLPRWPGESSSQQSMREGQSSSSQRLDDYGIYCGLDTNDRTHELQQQPATAGQLPPEIKQPQPPQNHVRKDY